MSDTYKDTGQPYIAWEDFGSEGWQPRYFETEKEVEDWICSGEHYQKWELTMRMSVNIAACNPKGEA